MLNGLDLFSGIGGISLALRDYVRPIAYCEIDPYCQGVLLSRMACGELQTSPIWDDVQTLGKDSGSFPINSIDIIYGGFPCQDISIAGLGKGLEGERSGLFFEIIRLAKEIKPKFIFLENVPAISTRGGLQVVNEFTTMGYDCRWCTISAASVGALHKRDRWFLLAHPAIESAIRYAERTEKEYALSTFLCTLSNPNRKPRIEADTSAESEQSEGETRRGFTGQYWPFESRKHWQKAVSGVCRTSDGVSFHVDRLRGLGNSVCPQQAKKAFEILMGL